MVLNPETLSLLDGLEAAPGKPLIEELVTVFVESSPKDIASIVESVKTGDFDTAEKIAHAMKSSTASMGLEILSAVFADIELAAHKNNAATLAPLAASLEGEYQEAARALRDFVAKN